MDVEELRAYCLLKKGVTEGFPFDQSILVFKVIDKMFAACSLDAPEWRVNLKCHPERAVELRDLHPEIIPGYHMNKKHWNTVSLEGELGDAFIKELIDHSYDLVVSKLSKPMKSQLKSEDES